MSSALKIARHYKDINSFIHINQTTFWADKYFSGNESRMQLENAYASKEWQNQSLKFDSLLSKPTLQIIDKMQIIIPGVT